MAGIRYNPQGKASLTKIAGGGGVMTGREMVRCQTHAKLIQEKELRATLQDWVKNDPQRKKKTKRKQ